MPHCIHFGLCGGCSSDDLGQPDKAGLLARALARAGYDDAVVAPLTRVALRTRRRVDLAASRKGAQIVLGLHRARSAEVVDMRECVLPRPDFLPLLPPLRELLRGLQAFRREASVVINWVDNGPDILIRADAALTQPDRARLIGFAKARGVPRLCVAEPKQMPEPVILLASPVLRFSGVDVTPPAGGFLQASPDGEAAIIAAMLAGLPRLRHKSRIIELYSGCGTLSFALAQHARVEAYESDEQAVYAADQAARAAGLAGRLSVTRRDLHRRPLLARDFSGAEAVVLDPPFAGAAAQMKFLAGAGVGRIVYVSCNPAALAQDAGLLRQAGYRLLGATPIDQFPFSENIESVVVFDRKGA
ncbi:class I SAM-dependent RNA methyltransferase [Acidocella sp.]|uniref:class I SAM-dependent RNA methyltransferase n=1 Tax=Acidocella sp. TaxID=50710 RepID=UPI003D037F3A